MTNQTFSLLWQDEAELEQKLKCYLACRAHTFTVVLSLMKDLSISQRARTKPCPSP